MKQLYIPLIIALYFFSSCNDSNDTSTLRATGATSVDSLPGTCPYLTRDDKGRMVLSWVRTTSDSSAIFCYAISGDGGRSFGQAKVVTPATGIKSHSENIPKIIFKPSGEIIAVWGAASNDSRNKYSGMVFYSQSFDEGQTWTGARPLVSDTAGYDQRYYDIALLPAGEVGIIWLDNRKSSTDEGSALYFASTSGRNGFQNEKKISESCCQCCRTDLFVDRDGAIHVLYRGIVKDSIRDMVHAVSIDGGAQFSSPRRISDDNWVIDGCPHTGPAMTENKNGLQFSWFTGGENKGCYYSASKDRGNSFAPRNLVSTHGSHPQLAAFTNDELVIVWDEQVRKDDNFYKRIAYQKRSADGSIVEKDFITSDTSMASYPVVCTQSENAVIAYTEKKGGKSYIFYQVLMGGR